MPPLIAFAGALGGLAVVRWAYKTAVRINRELEEARLARVAEAQTARHSDAAPRPRHRSLSAGLGQAIQTANSAMPDLRHRLDSPPPRRYGPALLNPPRETDSADGRTSCPYAPGTFVPGLHPRPAAVLGGAGLRDPAALRHGNGRRHLPSRDDAARARAEALERGLCAALAAAEGRPLRRKPQPAAALLPVSGDHEAVAAEPSGPVPEVARPRSASIRACTTSASSRTTGRARRSAPGGWAGSAGATAWKSSQFTYFQQVAGVECAPVAGELTYGLERLAMYVQGVDRVYDLNFNGRDGADKVTYGDVFLQAEQEYSRHNFEYADTDDAVRAVQDGRRRLQEISRRWLADRGQQSEGTSDGAAGL